MVFQRELTLRTHSAGEMHDLTDAVTRIVSESGVRTGIVQIFNVRPRERTVVVTVLGE